MRENEALVPFKTYHENINHTIVDDLLHNCQVIFMEANKLESMVRAMKAEKELCVQDIITFKKLRNSITARKRKLWFMTN